MKKTKDAVITSSADTGDLLSLLKSRLTLAKKWAKKPHDAYKEWMREYEIEDISDTDELRDKVRIGYIFRHAESDMPAIFDDQPELFFKGRGTTLKDKEKYFEEGYDYLWDIQHFDEKVEDAGLYFDILGMGIVKSPYVTKTKAVSEPQIDQLTQQPLLDAKGQPLMNEYEVPVIDNPEAEAVNLFKVYFSPETKFHPVLDYKHCPYLFEEQAMIKEEIKAVFGKDVDPTEILKLDDSDVNIDLTGEKDLVKDDLKRTTVYEYYGTLPEEQAREIKGDSDWVYDKDYHVYFTLNEVLKSEDSQYDIKPYFLVGNYGLANKFWKFGDAKHLKPLVRELEQYRTQILRHTRKMANPKPLIPKEGNIDKLAFRNPNVGEPVEYSGQAAPSYLNPPNLGAEVGVGVEQARLDLEKTSGSFDLNTGGGQSQVRSPRGIQVFSEAADKNIRRKRKKIARFIREIIIFQFKQIAVNWAPDDERLVEMAGENQQEAGNILSYFGDSKLLARLDIEVESLSVNRTQQRQDSLDLLELALKSEQLHPGLVNLTELWKDVLQNGYGKKDADRYLVSDQVKIQQGVTQFIQQIGAQNPQLGAAIAQQVQMPNLSNIQNQQQEKQMMEVPNAQMGGANASQNGQ